MPAAAAAFQVHSRKHIVSCKIVVQVERLCEQLSQSENEEVSSLTVIISQ